MRLVVGDRLCVSAGAWSLARSLERGRARGWWGCFCAACVAGRAFVAHRVLWLRELRRSGRWCAGSDGRSVRWVKCWAPLYLIKVVLSRAAVVSERRGV